MLHSQGDLVGGPPCFGELEMHLHRFWYHSLTPIYTCMLSYSFIYSMLCFDVHYDYVLFIRLEIYMFSYLCTHVHMDLYLVFSPYFRTNMYALDLMHMHMHYDHLDVYDYMMICLDDSCFSMIYAMCVRPLTCMFSL